MQTSCHGFDVALPTVSQICLLADILPAPAVNPEPLLEIPSMSKRFRSAVAAVSLAVLSVGPADVSAQAVSAGAPTRYNVYVGTYSEGGSKGIYHSDLDMKTGKLAKPELAVEVKNASFLAIHPNQRWLYSVNEVSDFQGKPAGAVTGFRFEKNGKLTEINQQSSVGAGPCHLAIDPSGKWLLLANYGGGSATMLPIDADGKLAPATSFIQYPAAGSQVSHGHCANFSPDGKYAFICDAGLDKVHQYRLDASAGKLVANDPAFVQIGPGSGTGPRHLTFSVDGKHAYVINETNLTISTLSYDGGTGVFKVLQTISTVPKDTVNKGFSTAEVVADPNGKFIFGSNRGFDSIATFAIDAKTAELTQVAQQKTGIKIPRNFNVDPTGTYLLAGNQAGDNVMVFRIDTKTGSLTPTGESIELARPVCIVFLAPR